VGSLYMNTVGSEVGSDVTIRHSHLRAQKQDSVQHYKASSIIIKSCIDLCYDFFGKQT